MVFEEFRISYGEGLTPTEQLLRGLGDRSFLRFWSHANPYLTPSQELCDLLVICGEYVIVFSDKSVEFNFDKDEDVAWGRWLGNAVTKSARQLKGATRHLIQRRDPVYKDRHCAIPLGIPVPLSGKERVYRVAVVSESRVWDESGPLQPILQLSGEVQGEQHVEEGAIPFKLGDVSPDSEFVHIMDVAGLWAVLSDLDTISDFARYLDARKAFLRGQPGNSAVNEWCMLACFLLSFDDDGEPVPLDQANPGSTQLDNSEWQSESTKAAFRARKQANRESYIWDRLVDRQADMIENQSFEFSTYTSVEEAERVVRHMALETRLNRRLLGRFWREACLMNVPGQGANVRTVPHSGSDGTTYVFLTLAHPDGMTYDDYRRRRRELLNNMVFASLIDVPTSEVIIGIGSEYGRVPQSYDLLHFNVSEDANNATIRADAENCWAFKKKLFGDPLRSWSDERDIPSANS